MQHLKFRILYLPLFAITALLLQDQIVEASGGDGVVEVNLWELIGISIGVFLIIMLVLCCCKQCFEKG